MMMKHTVFGAGLALAATVLLGGPALAQDTTTPAPVIAPPAPVAAEATPVPAVVPEGGAKAVVATVNGTDITLGHMIVLRNNLPQQYQSLPDDVLFKGILDQLVQQTALAQSVEKTLTLRDSLSIENDRRGYLSGVALASVAGGSVTDEALQKAYEARFLNAEQKKEFNAAHILVATEDAATKLKAEIDGGADFAELARVHSSDGAAANGGSLGWFSEGMMVAPFQEAVNGMEVGSVAGPVQTQFGWHLIQLKETRIAAAPPLDEVREDLAAEIEQATVEAHIAGLTKDAAIARPGEAFDPALLRDLTLLDK